VTGEWSVGPPVHVIHAWPSSGQMANVGNRYMMVCGGWNEFTASGMCELLDTKAQPMQWKVVENIPKEVCTNNVGITGVNEQ
jgi:hypothetical protein